MKLNKEIRSWGQPREEDSFYRPKKGPQEGRKEKTSFYSSLKWRKLRAQYLTEYPLCAHCEHEGNKVPARVVDHIVPIREGGAALDWDNLQGLCDKHHNRKSGKERHQKKGGER